MLKMEKVKINLQALGLQSIEAEQAARLAWLYAARTKGDPLGAMKQLEYMLTTGVPACEVMALARKWAPASVTAEDVARHVDCKIRDKGLGVLEAVDRVAADLTEYTVSRWDRKRVLLALAGEEGKRQVTPPGSVTGRPMWDELAPLNQIRSIWGDGEAMAAEKEAMQLLSILRGLEYADAHQRVNEIMARAVRLCSGTANKPSSYLWAVYQVVASSGKLPKGPCDRCESRGWVPTKGTITGAFDAAENRPNSRKPCPDCTGGASSGGE
jgi:hypothetical protein